MKVVENTLLTEYMSKLAIYDED